MNQEKSKKQLSIELDKMSLNIHLVRDKEVYSIVMANNFAYDSFSVVEIEDEKGCSIKSLKKSLLEKLSAIVKNNNTLPVLNIKINPEVFSFISIKGCENISISGEEGMDREATLSSISITAPVANVSVKNAHINDIEVNAVSKDAVSSSLELKNVTGRNVSLYGRCVTSQIEKSSFSGNIDISGKKVLSSFNDSCLETLYISGGNVATSAVDSSITTANLIANCGEVSFIDLSVLSLFSKISQGKFNIQDVKGKKVESIFSSDRNQTSHIKLDNLEFDQAVIMSKSPANIQVENSMFDVIEINSSNNEAGDTKCSVSNVVTDNLKIFATWEKINFHNQYKLSDVVTPLLNYRGSVSDLSIKSSEIGTLYFCTPNVEDLIDRVDYCRVPISYKSGSACFKNIVEADIYEGSGEPYYISSKSFVKKNRN